MRLFYQKSKGLRLQTQNRKNTCVRGEKGSGSLGAVAPRRRAPSPTPQTSQLPRGVKGRMPGAVSAAPFRCCNREAAAKHRDTNG